MKNRQLILALSIAVLLTGTAFGYWALSRSTTSALFAQLDDAQTAAAMAYLSREGVPFDIVNDIIMVESSRSSDLRMQLINEGVIQPGRSGFEMFSEVDYGQTEFSQRINYQRALQAELERSIISIDGVKFARVHLKVGQKKLLFSPQQPATASVMIQLKQGYSLSQKQVRGIQVLIAGAVDNIHLEDVSVIDQDGHILSKSGDGHSSEEIQDGATSLKTTLKSSAEALLSGVLEKGEFKVEVAIDYDHSKRKKRIESLANVQDKAILKRTDKEPSQSNDGATTNGQRHSQVEYVYGKQIEEIEYPSSVIRRISVGVVTKEVMDADAIADLNRLLFAGLGLQEDRGDVVSILVNQKKQSNSLEAVDIPSLTSNDGQKTSSTNYDSESSTQDSHMSGPMSYGYGIKITSALSILLALTFIAVRRYRIRTLNREREVLLEDVRKWLKSS